MSFSYDDKFLASGSADRMVRIWDVKTWKTLYVLTNDYNEIWGIPVAFSRNNKYLIIGAYENLIVFSIDDNFKILTRKFAHKKGIQSLYVSPDSKYVASAGVDGVISIWTLPDLSLIESKKGHLSEVWNICISEDNKYLISGGEDCFMKIWHFPSLTIFTNVKFHENPVEYVRISYDGKLLLQASADSTISVWKWGNYKEPYRILRSHIGTVLVAVFTKDSKYVISGGDDDQIYVYDIEKEEVLFHLKEHYADIMNITLNKDNTLIATASRDRTIKIWKLIYK